MKPYVPDPGMWAKYFEQVAFGKKQDVVNIKPAKRIIPIETARKGPTKDNVLVKLEAITPEQQFEERVKAELARFRKRKSIPGGDLEQTGGSRIAHAPRSKRRIACVDTSGF